MYLAFERCLLKLVKCSPNCQINVHIIMRCLYDDIISDVHTSNSIGRSTKASKSCSFRKFAVVNTVPS